ncbi:holo-acyl-carrier-protein synthase [Caldicellulosiruptor acetigenus I77R1B]|jgi:holo-[acyl-carrier protein] synthase|uniref:Holo-[acyl-carrier-protein] synthase n=2 Tax=Caldicellulosiruptor acetigenus TaxID=301953 RepID=G2PZC9_9FIRM|nr:holo-ACP synthase [Caldicellulosiruptor acetigenus]ADQ40317.1 holo-acyl-carrier-protein synthase [Caldicellulosiruptor acetigenus I77R1B]AEM74147.1 Holo-(acyl-carrier-protein) synthase [Caldicellulosiruptor acetigenus 6A]WAM37030.1 holo-ACP synthase [Caldicellulosiruptor acetigenus]
MIFNIGIDIVEVDRLKNMKRFDQFLKRVFTSGELEYIKERRYNPETIAGYFAAKEAVAKALSTGVVFCFKDIEIQKGKTGCPMVKLYNRAQALCLELGIKNIVVSISHQKSVAVAVAIAEK